MNFEPTQRNTDKDIEQAVFDTFFQAEVVFNNDSGRLVINQCFPTITLRSCIQMDSHGRQRGRGKCN